MLFLLIISVVWLVVTVLGFLQASNRKPPIISAICGPILIIASLFGLGWIALTGLAILSSFVYLATKLEGHM